MTRTDPDPEPEPASSSGFSRAAELAGEAVAVEAKIEARARDLQGDAFWAFVWSRVEACLVEHGEVADPATGRRRRRRRTPSRTAPTPAA